MPEPLPLLQEWESTKMTLHLYLQIVGKIRLKTMPRRNHWWNITLYVNSKGITTDSMPYDEGTFEIQFNFINHTLEIFTSKGEHRFFALEHGLSVADFYNALFKILAELNIHVTIVHKPYSLPDANPITTPFEEIISYNQYEKKVVQKFWQAMLWVDGVMKEFSGRYYGKTCPVHIYWHHFDLTITRFSGKRVPLPPGMKPTDKDAYSHEVISFGFWAGDENVPGAAFYSYTYPSPAGLEEATLEPKSAKWQINGSPMALLMYNDLLQEKNPRQALLNFFESAYQAGATKANWNVADMQVPEIAAL